MRSTPPSAPEIPGSGPRTESSPEGTPVPVAIDGLWGSFFSYANGTPMRTWPRRFWSRVRVVMGAPTELREASAMREAVLALLDR